MLLDIVFSEWLAGNWQCLAVPVRKLRKTTRNQGSEEGLCEGLGVGNKSEPAIPGLGVYSDL